MTSNTNQPEPSEQLDDDQDSFQEVMAILGAKHQCLHEDCDTFHHLPKRQQAEAILNWHNQAIAQAVREELEKLKAKAQYFGHNNFSTILASDINDRISQLGEQAE